MATTYIKPLHIGNGASKKKVINRILNYVKNAAKTDDGKLISAYECDPEQVGKEFISAKKMYKIITNRDQGDRDILAYHVRQAFKPGEITPEKANEIGKQLAWQFFGDNFAFVVCTHVDKNHIHNHIIVNSVNLDCNGKFHDVKRSGKDLRRISDKICKENELSVIKNPKKSRGKNYAEVVEDTKKPATREKICSDIQKIIPDCKNLEELFSKLETLGYKIDNNPKRKNISLLAPQAKKPQRLSSLVSKNIELQKEIERLQRNSESEKIDVKSEKKSSQDEDNSSAKTQKHIAEKLQEIILELRRTARELLNKIKVSNKKISEDTAKKVEETASEIEQNMSDLISNYDEVKIENATKLNSLIDVEKKIAEGKNGGYIRWANLYNIQVKAQTLLWLQKNNLTDFEVLSESVNSQSQMLSDKKNKIDLITSKLAEISALQKQIGTYAKTRETYQDYKKSGFSQSFYDANKKNIDGYNEAQNYFNSVKQNFIDGKIPKMATLKQEYATLSAEKNKLWSEYNALKSSSQNLQTAQKTMAEVLEIADKKEKEITKEKSKGNKNNERF